MKRVTKVMMSVWVSFSCLVVYGQTKVDEQRMEQDIEVAENILSTLLKQQFGRKNFLPIGVEGSYMSGYGVTFHLPQDGPMTMMLFKSLEPAIAVTPDGGTYSFSYKREDRDDDDDCFDCERERAKRMRGATARIIRTDDDSLRAEVDKKILEVAKNFLADYGDVISQLKAEEKIMVTNRGRGFDGDFRWPGDNVKRRYMSVEAQHDDIMQLKQGKLTRVQFMGKLKVVNTQTSDGLDPDLEVLASMFSRLYREDLSKTYYAEGDVNYERLKDFGAIYYMRVYSSNEDGNRFYMPTQNARNLSKSERDKKVTDLYPKFEAELKQNLLDYGRTLRSLGAEEQVVINVRMTKCQGCGIPSSLELSVKKSVLEEYSSGKTTREAALAKVNVKKGGAQ